MAGEQKPKNNALNLQNVYKNQSSVPSQPAQEDKNAYQESITKFKRSDIDPSLYGIKTVASNFMVSNTEVLDFITSFSRKNQSAGGCSITKSVLIELMIDVIYYDLGLRPNGFMSPHELREYLISRIKK